MCACDCHTKEDAGCINTCVECLDSAGFATFVGGGELIAAQAEIDRLKKALAVQAETIRKQGEEYAKWVEKCYKAEDLYLEASHSLKELTKTYIKSTSALIDLLSQKGE